MTSETLEIKSDLKIIEDKRTKAKSIAIPFYLPDGNNAALIITRLNRGDWEPSKDINKVTIEFND